MRDFWNRLNDCLGPAEWMLIHSMCLVLNIASAILFTIAVSDGGLDALSLLGGLAIALSTWLIVEAMFRNYSNLKQRRFT